MEDPRIISALFIFLKMAYYNVLINTHAYLHYDKEDITESTGDYEEQAERTAKMLLDFAGV